MTSTRTALIVAVAVGLVSTARVWAAPATASKEPARPEASTQSNSQTGTAIQGRSAFFGPYSMQVGRGLNIRAKFGFTIWSLDKPAEVNMLNAENKVFYPDTQAGWLRWSRRGVPPIDVSEVKIIDKPTISGRPCIHYYGYQKIRNSKVCVAEFTCLQKSPCDPRVLEFWCKHYCLPPKYGFPLKVKQRVGDRLDIVLETSSVRAVPVSAVAFQVPKDYKPTKDKAVMYFGDVGGGMSKSDLESFFQQPLK